MQKSQRRVRELDSLPGLPVDQAPLPIPPLTCVGCFAIDGRAWCYAFYRTLYSTINGVLGEEGLN